METIGNAGNIFLYIIGIIVFGIIAWLLNGMMDMFIAANIADTTTFNCWALLRYVWAGLPIVYILFGGIWLIRSFQSREYVEGGWQ